MKQAIIILGAGVMQGPVIRIAKELGYYAIVLDGSKEAVNISLADQFEQIDLKAKEEIESFARSLQSKFDRIGIMTAGTDFSASVAWVAEKLGLPGIPYETALNASDKSRMRECFKKAGVPSPEFVTITAEDLENLGVGSGEWGIGSFSADVSYHNQSKTTNNNSSSDSNSCYIQAKTTNISIHSLLPTPYSPLVVKPVDNMGSRGCRRVDSLEELQEAAKTALSFSRSGRAILEQYMDGPEFSVDAIVYHGEITICGLADRHIYFPPYFIEMGHTMPTEIAPEKQTAILDTFHAGIRALGIAEGDNIGAAKGDIKLTANGEGVLTGVLTPMIGEIAARLSGGYMSGWTYPYSSGAQPIKAAILMAMGEKPDGLIPTKQWTCAERAFISIPGTVKAITGVEEAKKMPYVNDVFLRIKPGDKVEFPQNNVTKCGNVIASAPDRETAVKAAEDAAKSILIHLDPTDKDTLRVLRASAPLCEGIQDNMKVELQITQKNAEIIVSTKYYHTGNLEKNEKEHNA